MRIGSLFGFPLRSVEALHAVRAASRSARLHGCTYRHVRWLLCISSLFCFALAGCYQVRPTLRDAGPPKQLVTYYLKGMFNPTMRRELYDLLTARARRAVPYRGFVRLQSNEVSSLVGGRTATDTRVSVSFYKQHDFSDDHSVVYALLYVRHPYSIGQQERYGLVRLHCHKEGERWAIQPFMHAETGTVILIPTRMRGWLWRIRDDMETITKLVEDEISIYNEREEPPPEKVVEAESPGEPPLVIPDIIGTEVAEPPAQPLATEEKVDALLSIGKLCYEAGRIDAAEEAFRQVLTLDPDNPIATDYLSRCKNYRLLQKEKEEAMRLMEELLRLDSERSAPK